MLKEEVIRLAQVIQSMAILHQRAQELSMCSVHEVRRSTSPEDSWRATVLRSKEAGSILSKGITLRNNGVGALTSKPERQSEKNRKAPILHQEVPPAFMVGLPTSIKAVDNPLRPPDWAIYH